MAPLCPPDDVENSPKPRKLGRFRVPRDDQGRIEWVVVLGYGFLACFLIYGGIDQWGQGSR